MNETEPSLIECFALALPGLSPPEIRTAKQEHVAAWDSIATINLINLVEERFHVDVPPEQMEQFSSFENILTFINEHAR